MVKQYLNSLKERGNFSWEDISLLSGIPEDTARKIFRGETADPRLDTVHRLVSAMGGNLNDIYAKDQAEQKNEANTIVMLKETYEARMADVKDREKLHEIRIADLKEREKLYETRVSELKDFVQSLQRDRRFLIIAVCVVSALLIALLVIDASIGSHGWIKY